jgi:thioester reductase-like protein
MSRGAHTKFIFCSSTASVTSGIRIGKVPEKVVNEPSTAGNIGYSKSKWVAEHICNTASLRSEASIRIARIGQLTGDTQHGIWNMNEGWPLMLSTVHELGCLPDLDEPLSWLPLDTASQAIIDISLSEETPKDKECQVYHVVNSSPSTTWKDLLTWLKPIHQFDIVAPNVWLDKLEALKSHPAKQLLGLWRKAYVEGKNSRQTCFETKEVEGVSKIMRDAPRINEDLFLKIWEWMEGERGKSESKGE